MKIQFMRKLWLLSGLLIGAISLQAQADRLSPSDADYIRAQEDTLSLLAYAVLNDSTAEERFLACREMIPRLVDGLKRPHSFQYDFDRLGQHVSVQYPADSSFRIFTWQLHVNRDEYRYYGAIQLNSPDLKLYPLIDRSFELPDPIEQLDLAPDRWYGNVVYNIQQVTPDDAEPYYLLYGFDSYSTYRRRKLLDVLQFVDGQPSFGRAIFAGGADPSTGNSWSARKRLLLEYSAAVSVTLRFDEDLQQIMMDHLILMDGQYGEGPVFVPDGSYEAFKLQEDGSWAYIEKVFHHTFDVAPREAAEESESNSGRDLFGRRRN